MNGRAMIILWVFALVVLAAGSAVRAGGEPPVVAGVEPAAAWIRRSSAVDVRAEELDAAVARGRAFLVSTQNPDGSFGSAERTKDLNIMAGVGSHFGFRAATTALCVQALIEEETNILRARRGLRPDQPDDFALFTSQAQLEQFQQITGGVAVATCASRSSIGSASGTSC